MSGLLLIMAGALTGYHYANTRNGKYGTRQIRLKRTVANHYEYDDGNNKLEIENMPYVMEMTFRNQVTVTLRKNGDTLCFYYFKPIEVMLDKE